MISTAKTLQVNKDSGKGSLIGYFPAGFPTIEDSVEAIVTMALNGCDIIEIGLPYSDPVMDGIVIQQATEVSLANGFRIKELFEIIKRVRAKTDIPLLVMSYWNPVLSYGLDKFASQLAASGAQGMITPDLIPDEGKDWFEVSDKYDLDRVFLVAPSSSDARIQANSDASRGFVYSVSTMGVTGERAEVDKMAREVAGRVKSLSGQITCVGVGISKPEQVREVNTYSDGAIVGAAFVKAYQSGGVDALKAKTIELAGGLG